MNARLEKEVFTTFDAAKLLGTTDTSVKRWIQSGHIEAYKTPGGHHRIPRASLEGFIERNNIPVSEYGSPRGKILIVDDQKDIRELFRSVISGYSDEYEIEEASDGFSAGKMVARFEPDLIILDLIMPFVDGFSVCRDIKLSADTQHIKVIVVTGYYTKENIERATDCGADAILKKPVQTKTLIREITKQLPDMKHDRVQVK